MGFAIPKLIYKPLDTTGDVTTGSGNITSIPDTTDVEVGMFVRGTGIPDGATVASKTASSVTLAGGVLATGTAAAEAIEFGYEIVFTYPPIEEGGEVLETNAVVSTSLSGIRQTAVNYTQGIRKLKFSHISQTIYNSMVTFLETSGLLGQTFRYYEDQTVASYVEYELDSLKVEPKKIAPKGVDIYVWEMPLVFRRVV